MVITVECIHRVGDSTGKITDGLVLCTNNMSSESNRITCKINSVTLGNWFYLPLISITLNDVLNFSNNMSAYQQYDCVLEITSFKQVDLFTNHSCSLRGKYWRNIPKKYLPKYHMYKEQECIEVGDDILLISIYNNTFTNKITDGELVEIILIGELNLISTKD